MIADVMTSAKAHELREYPDLFTGASRRKIVYLVCKRALDLILAPILLCLTSPILVLAAILIKLDSSGPVIFVQERVGAKYIPKNGGLVWRMRVFRCYKLRSMTDRSDHSVHKEYLRRFRLGHAERQANSGLFKLTQDNRVTRIGRLLRKTSLDELPQLVNVINGDMSLVGPRPVPVYEVEMYDAPHYQRLTALPGITGAWQVYGRSRVSFEEAVQMDIEYVRKSSIWLDIKLLLLTVPCVFSFKGAA